MPNWCCIVFHEGEQAESSKRKITIMKVHPVAHISSLMGTTLMGCPDVSFVEHLLIDSRKLVFPQTTLFLPSELSREMGINTSMNSIEKG